MFKVLNLKQRESRINFMANIFYKMGVELTVSTFLDGKADFLVNRVICNKNYLLLFLI